MQTENTEPDRDKPDDRHTRRPCGHCVYFGGNGLSDYGPCLLGEHVALPPWITIRPENRTVYLGDTCELFDMDGPLT